jgi:glycosyltransferase involved in cell wall biosynthesis
MKNPAHISIIMPTLNQGTFIRQAIDSVLTQTYPDKSLTVYDGGSTDETLDILKSYGDRIRFVSGQDEGQSDAINRGIANARGPVVCWLNSDDAFEDDALTRVMKVFNKKPDVDFIYGRGCNMSQDGQRMDEAWVREWNLWRLIHHKNFIQQPSCFFRKAMFEEVGGLDLSLHYVMDWDLWIRFGAYKHAWLDTSLSLNRVYAANKTASGGWKRWREIRRMVRRYTPARFPPVLYVYLFEIIFQRTHLAPLKKWAMKKFVTLMHTPCSGVLEDGRLLSRFHLSAGNSGGKQALRVELESLQSDHLPLTIHWKNTLGQKGAFNLTGVQQVDLPLAPCQKDNFVHYTCRAVGAKSSSCTAQLHKLETW